MDDVCGLPLTTWGLGIGWFDLIFSLLLVIFSFIAGANLDKLVESLGVQVTNPNLAECAETFVGFFVFISFLLAIGLVLASALLILGVRMRHHRYMAPWLTVCALIIFIGLFEIFFNQITLKLSLVALTCFLILRCPMFYVIYVLYKNMHDENLSMA